MMQTKVLLDDEPLIAGCDDNQYVVIIVAMSAVAVDVREIIKIFKYMLTTPGWETIYHCTAGKPVHLKRGALALIFPIFRVNFFWHMLF